MATKDFTPAQRRYLIAKYGEEKAFKIIRKEIPVPSKDRDELQRLRKSRKKNINYLKLGAIIAILAFSRYQCNAWNQQKAEEERQEKIEVAKRDKELYEARIKAQEDEKRKSLEKEFQKNCRIKLEEYSLGEIRANDQKCFDAIANERIMQNFGNQYAIDCQNQIDMLYQIKTRGDVGWNSSLEMVSPHREKLLRGGRLDTSRDLGIPSKFSNSKEHFLTYRFPKERRVRGIVFLRNKDNGITYAFSCPAISYDGAKNKFGKMDKTAHLDPPDAWSIILQGKYDQVE